MWGYVVGGMGMVSFLLCDAARAEGAVVATGVPVARIVPGEGVELEGGEKIQAPVVVSNADPKVTLKLLGDVGRSRLAGEGRLGADRGLHGQAERGAPRVARLHRAGRELASRTTSARSTRR